MDKKKCPNCGSSQFIDIITVERCPACGLECNYHGGGPNKVYLAYLEQKWAEERLRDEEESRAYMDRKYGEGNW